MISRRTMMNDEIVSKSGNIAQLEKCKGSYLNGLQLFGKSEQFKTNGLQLFDARGVEKNNTLMEDGTIAPNGNVHVSDFIKVIPNTTYSISNVKQNRGKFYNADKQPITTDRFDFEPTNSPQFTIPEDVEYIRFSISNAVDLNTVMLNKSNTVISWEPYTGGIPAPNIEYPQEIVSAGRNGSVEVDVNGSNFLNITDGKNDYVSVNVQNDEITIKKLVTTDSMYESIPYYFTLRAGSYILCCDSFIDFSFSKSGSRCDLYIVSDTGQKWLASLHERGLIAGKFFLDKDENIILKIRSGYKEVGKSYKIKGLRINKLAKQQWEQYKTPQKLVIATPNGLPGIPVSKDGNYTDENGQQWVCDEIDLDREKYVQRIAEQVYNKLNLVLVDADNNKFQNVLPGTYKFKGATYPSMSNFAHYMAWANNKGSFAAFDKYFYYRHTEKITVDEINTLFNSMMPVKIRGQLETPIERDLTAEEIEQYKALHTYTGTTVLSNDAEVYMKATYRKFK